MHAPIPETPAREGECRASASYNFFRKNSWLTESFRAQFAANFHAIREQGSLECDSEAAAFAVATTTLAYPFLHPPHAQTL